MCEVRPHEPLSFVALNIVVCEVKRLLVLIQIQVCVVDLQRDPKAVH